MTEFRRQYPKQNVYLDGKLIISHYGETDRRNVGSGTISMMFDPETETGRFVLEIEEGEFPVRLFIGIMTYPDSEETTQIFTLYTSDGPSDLH